MTTTSPRLVTWESGTDLVIELPVARDIETVWNALTDAESAGTWFAPFRLGEDAGPDADESAARPITFALDDADLAGSVLSCEEYEHVLLELDGFGVLGVRLVPATGDTGEGTVIVFTQTSADAASARSQAADFGPMWDTHLRLFARSLGLDVAEATEPELDTTYSNLDLETIDADQTDGDHSDIGATDTEGDES